MNSCKLQDKINEWHQQYSKKYNFTPQKQGILKIAHSVGTSTSTECKMTDDERKRMEPHQGREIHREVRNDRPKTEHGRIEICN